MEKLLQNTKGTICDMSFSRHIGIQNIKTKRTKLKVVQSLRNEYFVIRRFIPNELLSSIARFRFNLQRNVNLF